MANNLGHALAGLKRYSEAIACYERALRLDPKLAIAQYNLAEALSAEGRLNEAVEQYIRMLPNSGENPQVQYGLAKALAGLGREDEARTRVSEALRLNPDYAEARELWQALNPRQ